MKFGMAPRDPVNFMKKQPLSEEAGNFNGRR
jgi:hypothetical protein